MEEARSDALRLLDQDSVIGLLHFIASRPDKLGKTFLSSVLAYLFAILRFLGAAD